MSDERTWGRPRGWWCDKVFWQTAAMLRILDLLGGRAVEVLFFGVFLGVALPPLAALARPLLAPTVVALLLLALLRVDWGAMADYARRPLFNILVAVWMLLASPLLFWLVLGGLSPPPALNDALILMAAAPPIVGVTSFALFLGLDAALCVVSALVATLIVPLTAPGLVLVILGLELEVSPWELMGRLALMVALAFFGAWLLRKGFGKSRLERHGRVLDGAMVLGMLIFAVAIMDGVQDALFSRPMVVLVWTLAAFAANLLLQALGAAVFSWAGRRVSVTVGLLSGNCNMGLMMGALPSNSEPDILLYFALAQLPMFMLPALLKPLYQRLAGT